MAVLIAGFGIVGFLGALMLYGVITSVVVLSALWVWFVTPTFGWPVPSWPMLAGLSVVTHYLTGHVDTTYKDHDPDWGKSIAATLIAPWFVLFAAWLIHLWSGA